jgi:hypothetical protein
MLHIKLSAKAVHTEKSKSGHVIDVGHDEHAGDVVKRRSVRWALGDAVCIQIVEEGVDSRVGFRNVHFLRVELEHLGGPEARKVWPASLEDELVDMNRGGGRRWTAMTGRLDHRSIVRNINVIVAFGGDDKVCPAPGFGGLVESFGKVGADACKIRRRICI